MAGKTGTCQTEYWIAPDLYISSFAGYFPAENPKYSCIVVIHKPDKKIGYYGNVVAAPVFKKIAQKIYSETPIEKTIYKSELMIDNKAILKSSIDNLIINENIMPNISNLELSEAVVVLENLGLKVEINGKGNKIRFSIKAGEKIKKNQKVIIQLS
jgi:cell division protein FtsI (penicillin-binding protein 3)